jgi:UDPglucose 6-dehydrogenase
MRGPSWQVRTGKSTKASRPPTAGRSRAASRTLYGDKVTLCDSMYDAAEGADALALVTEWHEYRRPDVHRIKRLMRAASLLDGRNIWDPEELRSLGFWYTDIGRR